jgi:Caspase domain
MAGRYRALLIGNSTYPADEHNLQTLKGPVKDIAALNRALLDPATGLFADADVTLLPEATSSRAVRALGRFFAAAARDDVLLVYFSGHGKLDQSGRLHLCMQDTESTDLLSSAVSSVRISEFADASHARNIIIVLDCCHAGAFRGGDLGDAVAGPGRYVLTSCRGTQLANDATAENGTSHFTQQLIDGLLGGAAGQDEDGYIRFSDLYAYVDRRLREAGKQIPQRRMHGDGDVPLARRSLLAPGAVTAEATAPATAPAMHKSGPPPGSGPVRARRRAVLAGAAGVAVLAGGVITAIVLLNGAPGGSPGASASANTYTARGPWRLMIDDDIQGADPGCTVTLTDAHSGRPVLPVAGLTGRHLFQIHQIGSFRWRANDHRCVVTPLDGPGSDQLPMIPAAVGDSDAFAVPSPPRVAVHVKDYSGTQECLITLIDPASGQQIDFKTARPGQDRDTVVLDVSGHASAYLSDLDCQVQASRAP